MSWYLSGLSTAVFALVSLVPGVAWIFGGVPAAPETIRRTLSWPAGTTSRVLELSNINGSVRIVADDRADVAVTATRTVERQDDASDPGPAVEFRQASDHLLVCGDGRHCGCHLDRDDNWRGDRRRRETRVRVEFEVRVPRNTTLDVCTVNGGTLRVEGTEAPFTLRNVNGSLEMVGVKGAGRASTVNGRLDASFTAAPDGPTSFRTVNGRIDVTLPSTLSADLRLKTMNGALFTDFETVALPAKAATVE